MLEAVNSDRAKHSALFFKTGKGEYGEGDRFLGIRVPETRKLVKKFREISLEEIIMLLHSEYHEIRLFALLSLVLEFQEGDAEIQKMIYNLYLN